MTAARLHLLMERLSSLFRASLRDVATRHGLKLVQLEALVYLSVANRYSDTPVALTEYFGITKGTVSQTLKALERRGLIDKHADDEDGRVLHCAVTAEGRAIVAEAFPASCFVEPEDAATDAAVAALEGLLRTLQKMNGHRTFGQCRTCRFYQPRAKGGRCGLTHEALSKADSTKICREHEHPSPDP